MRFFLLLALLSPPAFALQAQPVPIPEDQSAAPQLDVSGVGVGTVGFGKTADDQRSRGLVSFSDSAIQVGAAQRLFESGGVGSMGFGFLTTDDPANPFFLHRAFVDLQGERYEALLGRSDNPTSHVIDLPTLRGDDLVTLTNSLNPFSNGKNAEEHRYSNVASFTLNQGLRFFENVHAQHLLRTDRPEDQSLSSFGVSFQALGAPGLESVELLPSWAAGYERINARGGLNQAYAGATVRLQESVVNRLDLSLQDLHAWGSGLAAFSNATDTFAADSNAASASLRYLNSPFGRPSWQVALTGGYRSYPKVSDASSWGFALTGARRLGHGFDLVAQLLGQRRSTALALAQTQGLRWEQKAEIGFSFNFDATVNEHIAPRRSLLNQQHGYLSP